MPSTGNSRPGRSMLWRAFMGALGLLALLQFIVLAYVFFGPVVIEPHGWHPKANADVSGPYVPNDALTRGRLVSPRWVEPGNRERIRYQGAGPETIAVGPGGHLYTGLCDAAPGGKLSDPPPCLEHEETQGWIMRVNPKDPHDVERYVRTGGRPLGLAFDDKGQLYIADGEKGLLRVQSNLEPGVAAATEAAEVEAEFHAVVPVATCNLDDDEPDDHPGYADSVDVGPDGTVWFTSPSQRWPLAEISNDLLENQPTGRVFRYRPCTADDPLDCDKQLMLDGLMYANGIAVRPGGRSVLVNEWAGFRIKELHLNATNEVMEVTDFMDNTPGYPDNLTIAEDGTVWVGLVIRRNAIVDRLRPYPFLVSALARLPGIELERYAWVIGLDPEGKLRWSLQDETGFFDQATGAYPLGDALYIGSYTETDMLCVKHPGRELDHDPCDPWAKPPELAAALVPAAGDGGDGLAEPQATTEQVQP